MLNRYFIFVTLLLGFTCCIFVTTNAQQQEDDERPEFKIYQSRVKQHRSGATGQLVEGEEELRKIILGWYEISNALEYEICHQCFGNTNNIRIDEQTGKDLLTDTYDATDGSGTIHKISIDTKCGGQPCLVLPSAPIGQNTFHMRYKAGEDNSPKWSLWSKVKIFNVDKENLGTMEEQQQQHEEL